MDIRDPNYNPRYIPTAGTTLHRLQRVNALRWLVAKGALSVFCTSLPDLSVYQLYVIACNILCPDNPDKAHKHCMITRYRLQRGGRFNAKRHRIWGRVETDRDIPVDTGVGDNLDETVSTMDLEGLQDTGDNVSQ